MDLHHKILKDLKWFYEFYRISKDFMNFKDSLKKNCNTLFFTNILNTNSFILFYFTREREREWERREGKRQRKGEREEERSDKREEDMRERVRGEREREEERRDTREEEMRERGWEERDNKILKEKTISRFHERLFYSKISVENPTKSTLLNNPSRFEWFWIPQDFF